MSEQRFDSAALVPENGDVGPARFLERLLPIGWVALAIPVVGVADDKLFYVALCTTFAATNVAVSRLARRLERSAGFRVEVAKNLLNAFVIGVEPLVAEHQPPFWLFGILVILRLVMTVSRRDLAVLLMVMHVVVPTVCCGLAEGSLQAALAPAGVLTSIAFLFSGVVAYLTEQLQATRVRHALIQRTTDMFYQVSLDGRIMDCNPAVVDQLGYAREELLGRPVSDLYGEQSRERVPQLVQGMRQGSVITDVEMQVVGKHGQHLNVLLSAITVVDAEGKPACIASVQKDVSARVKEASELRLAKQQAEAADQAKTDFLAMMSHEIRTPMNGVIGTTDLLLETTLSQEQTTFVHTIQACGDGLLAIIDDILDYSKIQAGCGTLRRTVLRPHDLVTGVVTITGVRARSKGLELFTSFGRSVPEEVVGDDVRLRQVLINLVGNATKFTDTGSIEVAVSLQRTVEEIAWLRFEVIDTGVGMADDTKAMLFEPFRRGTEVETRSGTGLGLAICKRLVEMMGGSITAESTLGQGTTFVFELPLKVMKPDATLDADFWSVQPVTPPPEDTSFAQGLSILIAEDNRVNYMIVRRMLEDIGCRVDVVENGEEAANAVARQEYDVVLMDCQMPILDGYGATKRIRQEESRGRIPIIALTANAMSGDREKCLAAGMDDYIAKPVKRVLLISVLARWMRGRVAV